MFARTDAGELRLNHNLKLAWLLIGVGVVVVAAAYMLGSISMALMTLVFAGLIVFILRKPVDWLEGKGVPRMLATALLLVVFIALIIAIIVSFIPLIVNQSTELVQQISSYVGAFQDWWDGITASDPNIADNGLLQIWIEDIGQNVADWFDSFQKAAINALGNSAMTIANAFIVGLTAFIVAFWILLGYKKMSYEMHVLCPRRTQYYLTLVTTIFSRVLGGFLKGTIIGAIVTGVLAGIAYWIIGMPFPLVLGILAGLLSIIPYLGPFVTAVVMGVLGLFVSPFTMILAIVISAVVPWLIGTFVSPRIMESTVNLHPGIILLAILAGGALGGAFGMLAAIPVTAAVKCLIVFIFESYTGRQLVAPDGELFDGEASDEIDPVADATNGYLTHQALLEKVNAMESTIRKIPDEDLADARARIADEIAGIERRGRRTIHSEGAADDDATGGPSEHMG